MSCRVSTTSLIAGACVVGNRGLGVLGATVRSETATGAHGAGYLYNDWASGDDAKEFRGLIVTPPSAGAFFAYENGSFDLTGAADGAYTFVYRLFVDGVDLGTATASITIGAVAGMALSAAACGQANACTTGSFTIAAAAGMALTPADCVQGNTCTTAAFALSGAGLVAVVGADCNQSSSCTLGAFTLVISASGGRYCVLANLTNRFGDDEMIQISRPTDPTALTVDELRVGDAIADIDALIDAKLAPRFTIPLASVPRVLRNIACDLVRARLYEDRISDHVAARERQALKLLDEISSGKLSLGLDDAAQATPVADGPQFTTPNRVFTAGSLADYAP